MTPTFRLRVIDEHQKQAFVHDYSGRVELGRQDRDDPGPFSQKFEAGRWRLIVARLTEDTVSRCQLTLEPLEQGRIRLRNPSKTIPIRLVNGEEVRPGETRDLLLPAHIYLSGKVIYVDLPESLPEDALQELPEATRPPGAFEALATRAGGLGQAIAAHDTAGMIRSLRVAMEVLQAAASSFDFFSKAAQAAADLVDLDSASVWLLRDGEWLQEAYATPARVGRSARVPVSRQVLDQVRRRAKTLWDKPTSAAAPASLDAISAVVAAPIMNRQAEVIGALYGDRSLGDASSGRDGAITELQAMLVELLASGIAAGLERVRQEQAAIAARVQFEQFFTPDLARELERHPDLLNGREREATILFCDIRGFSMISERLKDDPPRICRLVGAVMDRLTECIRHHEGVVVDYLGDGLMAMWNAPADQERHAVMACRAVLAMLEEVPALSSQWSEVVGGPLKVGFGINTGPVIVGNTGSRAKFKYGPLGHVVNLASRVEGATKQLGVPALITGATFAQLDGTIATRRVCQTRVVGIADAVELYEIHGEDPGWKADRDTYETALSLFEAGQLPAACRVLHSLLAGRQQEVYDVPTLDLIGRAVTYLKAPSGKFDPILELRSK